MATASPRWAGGSRCPSRVRARRARGRASELSTTATASSGTPTTTRRPSDLRGLGRRGRLGRCPRRTRTHPPASSWPTRTPSASGFASARTHDRLAAGSGRGIRPRPDDRLSSRCRRRVPGPVRDDLPGSAEAVVSVRRPPARDPGHAARPRRRSTRGPRPGSMGTRTRRSARLNGAPRRAGLVSGAPLGRAAAVAARSCSRRSTRAARTA